MGVCSNGLGGRKSVDDRQEGHSRQMQKVMLRPWQLVGREDGYRRHAAGTRKAQQSQGKGGADRERQAGKLAG